MSKSKYKAKHKKSIGFKPRIRFDFSTGILTSFIMPKGRTEKYMSFKRYQYNTNGYRYREQDVIGGLQWYELFVVLVYLVDVFVILVTIMAFLGVDGANRLFAPSFLIAVVLELILKAGHSTRRYFTPEDDG